MMDQQVSSYKGLKFLSFRLESPINTPKISVFGEFYPQNLRARRSDPQRGTSLRDFTSFELSRVKIHPQV